MRLTVTGDDSAERAHGEGIYSFKSTELPPRHSRMSCLRIALNAVARTLNRACENSIARLRSLDFDN
jgi:hypothetical protein